MWFRTGLLLSAAIAAVTLTGCANVTTGQALASFDTKPTEVCIVRNPKVRINAAIPSLQSAFRKRGIATTVVEAPSDCKSEYRLNYVMRRSWDFTTYLGAGELTLLRNDAIVSTSSYKARSLTLTKWGKTEERIDEMVGKLLGEP